MSDNFYIYRQLYNEVISLEYKNFDDFFDGVKNRKKNEFHRKTE